LPPLGASARESGLDPESAVETLSSIRSYLGGESGTRVKLEGDDIEALVVVGLTYEFLPGHRLGLAYNYMSDFKFEGNATIKGRLLSDET
jgi:long-chain fatty acid transport protein